MGLYPHIFSSVCHHSRAFDLRAIPQPNERLSDLAITTGGKVTMPSGDHLAGTPAAAYRQLVLLVTLSDRVLVRPMLGIVSGVERVAAVLGAWVSEVGRSHAVVC